MLLVDDVVEVRRLVRTALRFRGGFDVVAEAKDGVEAVRLADSLQPDIVVLDLGLPDIAGREVLSRIRTCSPGTKVVIFSGVDAADRAWFTENAEGYVLKDAKLDYLVDLLETVATRSEAEATLDLPQAMSSVGAARGFVRQKVTEWELDQLLEDALLVISELTTNAITHAESGCRVRLALNSATLRIDVLDGGSGTPEPHAATTTDEGGRGLAIVDAVTSAWGLEIVPGNGKLVWAELARGH